MNLSGNELKELLDSLVDKYNRQEFISDDPILIPHRFSDREDIEISGFLAALIAWGSRTAIIKAASFLMELMDNAPGEFIRSHEKADLKRFSKFVYRTMQPDDIRFIISALQRVYGEFGSLESLFTAGMSKDSTDVYPAISFAREELMKSPHQQRSCKHIADPGRNSAAKRINLFLRWMVRSDDRKVDFGLWKSIRPAQLICPLDIHTGNAARALAITSRNTNDRKTAEEITARLREFDPEDPVKYDFALFGFGKEMMRP